MSTPSPSSSQAIRFYHRGEIVEVQGPHTTKSVLEWLREDARCTGTKEGCNEGDCGACTVVIGELADGTNPGPGPGAAPNARPVGGLNLQTVNACIQFLPTLHGKALFTVEDLKSQCRDQLHPVQQAMVECHGSQCGFCTPGFVMSLWSTYEHQNACGSRPSRQQLADDLSGNLCRCTGYRPILDAGQRMFDLPAAKLDTAPVVAALEGLKRSETFSYAAPLALPGGEVRSDRIHAPKTIAQLAALRAEKPKATLLAGSTDVGLWVNKMFRDLGEIIYTGDVDEMKVIAERDGHLWIGASASLESAWTALVERAPQLTDTWLRFASPPIRNAGTMGGNVANGSPIGDSPPVLISLDAQIELRQGERVRRMLLADFYVDYMKNRLEPGEFVQAIAVPLASFSRQVRSYKISKRFDCDISALLGAFTLELDGETVKTVRLAYGGMAATCKRAAKAEAALAGQPWTQASVDAAKAALAEDFKPLTDMRASAAYRMQVAQNLLQRLWLETRTHQPLPIQSTSVWSVMPHTVSEGA